MKNEAQIYDEIWEERGGREHAFLADRLRAVRQMIPEGVETIIDVGCGDGAITNALAGDYRIAGADISRKALEYLSGEVESVHASADDLPFLDKSFNLVLCCELLEHLDIKAFRGTLRELDRVAEEYILVSVPNEEVLSKRLTRCNHCHFDFHIYRHKRSFSLGVLQDCFPNFELVGWDTFGPPEGWNSDWLNELKHRWANAYFYIPGIKVSCPNCRLEVTPIGVSLWCRAVGRLLYIFEQLVKKALPLGQRPNWLLVLFGRTNNQEMPE